MLKGTHDLMNPLRGKYGLTVCVFNRFDLAALVQPHLFLCWFA